MEKDPSWATDSPSLVFLRDVAHVSDHAPNAFDLRLSAEDAAAVAPGGERFLVRRRLGAGGFGVVYEAFDRERNATVALKVLSRSDPRAVSRFKREFRSLVEILHENLVQLYELHAEDDTWFFTMELVRGGDALAHVRSKTMGETPLPPGPGFDEARLRAVLRQLAAGLSFLHRSGKLHRDVKPSNVMVTGEGRVVLLDFGLVADLDDLPVDEGILGTPAYMAPEQAAGLRAGTAADWFAVGVMLYEALTGRLPFHGRSEGHDPRLPPPPPSTVAAGVPEDLDKLCMDLLTRAPERRPTGREVRERLSHRSRPAEGDATGREARGEAARYEPPFVGRAAHLAKLRDALSAAERGPVVVRLHGRSGMGKSALVQRFFEEVRAREPRRLALSGRCFEQESVPYKGVDGLVDDLCRRLSTLAPPEREPLLPPDFALLARLFPQLRQLAPSSPSKGPLASVEGPPLRSRAFAALAEILRRATPCPVLAVDDLQWGDLDSVALLADLLQAPEPVPLLLVASYRTEEAEQNPVLRALATSLDDLAGRVDAGAVRSPLPGAPVDVRTVEVGELDGIEAEALSRSLLEADGRSGDVLAETTVRAIVAEAHGSPFLLAELSRHQPGRRRAADSIDSRTSTGTASVEDMGSLLAARIGKLPEPARRLLEVVAVAGQPVARATAARAAYGSEPESQELGTLGLLRAARLLRSQRRGDREELLPYHDRIRETVLSRLAPEAGTAHHERLALVLEAEGGEEPERLLRHFRGAGRPRDAKRYAERAAALAQEALAFDRAARLYREALALGAAPPEARALHDRLGDALAGAGRPREAALAYLAAAQGAAPAEALARRRRAVEHLLGAGYLEEGQATLRDVLREVGIDLPGSPAASLLSFAALRLRLRARGLGFHERPERDADERTLVRVDACAAAAMGLIGINPILAAESQARHLLIALEAGEPYRVARALHIESVVSALQRGRPHAATDRVVAAARAIGARLQHPHLDGLALLAAGVTSMVAARWREARERLAESEATVRDRCPGAWWELDHCRLHRATCLWMLGEVAELSRLVPALVDEARERGNRHVETAMSMFGAPLCALSAGHPERATAAIEAALRRWPRRRGSLQHVREVSGRARIALYEGRGHAARAVLEEAWSTFYRSGLAFTPLIGAELRLTRALALLATGDLDRAAADARAIARASIPWAANGARMVLACVAQRRGDLGGALSLVEPVRRAAKENGVALFGAAIERRRGAWIGGDEGRAFIAAADAGMRERGVADPERMAAMLVG